MFAVCPNYQWFAGRRAMDFNDFTVGGTFWCGGEHWHCTDIGTRVVVAIRIDRVAVDGSVPELQRTLGHEEAEAEG